MALVNSAAKAALVDLALLGVENQKGKNSSSTCLTLPKQKLPVSTKISSTAAHVQDERKREKLCTKWREVQGAQDWLGLAPLQSVHDNDDDLYQSSRAHESQRGTCLDEALRSEIIKYGEFAQVCYDTFDNEEHSHSRGNSKFSRGQLLQECTPTLTGYEVTEYLYATARSDLPSFFSRPKDRQSSWSNDSNWMGFVAVSTSEHEISRLGRRDIVISWRGTVTGLEWMQNLHDFLQPTGLDPSDTNTTGVKVESGFLNLYTSKNPRSRYNKRSAREQLLSEVKRLVRKYCGEELSITVTGHSLGGALGLISAYDIAELGLNLGRIPTTVFSFSAPRVGNRQFADRLDELNVQTLRVVNKRDMVPKVPGLVFNEHHEVLSRFVESVLPWTYTHAGSELALDTSDSPFLREDGDLISQHNLEALLHLVDGYQGPERSFRPSGKRDIRLVNKDSDLLRPEFGVPPFWKKLQN